MKPYYDHAGITLYLGDNREILPTLPKVDLVLTDPPYGIGADRGKPSGSDGSGFYSFAIRKEYGETWDTRPTDDEILEVVAAGKSAIVWGGNYFANCLPEATHWLVWDKQNTMPTFSDCELAWTNLAFKSVKMLRLNGNGLLGEEKDRVHPTQKPLKLMSWCLSRVPEAKTIIDPYAGSGTTLVAAKERGLKAIGIEGSEAHCESIALRLSQEVMDFSEVA